MKMSSVFRSLVVVGAVGVASVAHAAGGGGKEPMSPDWSFKGVFGTFDRAAMQRGFQVYKEVCASCHGMELLSYRNLGQKDGPFEYVKVGDKLKRYANPNDNPVVKAIAAEYTVEDGPDEAGDMFERPGRPADNFSSPFPNDNAARAANNQALPPDLSVITKARGGGADYIYSLLAGYADAPEGLKVGAGQHYNPYFPGDLSSSWEGRGKAPVGGLISMAPPLMEGLVEYSDGTEATVDQMAKDVTVFLAWAAEPKMEERKRLGFGVMIFLSVLAALLWGSYKALWRDIKH